MLTDIVFESATVNLTINITGRLHSPKIVLLLVVQGSHLSTKSNSVEFNSDTVNKG